MKKLLDSVRESYDYVLLDGPALLVSDAKALAALVEGTLVVEPREDGIPVRVRAPARVQRASAREDPARHPRGGVDRGRRRDGVENLKGGYFGQLYKAFQDYNKKENQIVKPVN